MREPLRPCNKIVVDPGRSGYFGPACYHRRYIQGLSVALGRNASRWFYEQTTCFRALPAPGPIMWNGTSFRRKDDFLNFEAGRAARWISPP